MIFNFSKSKVTHIACDIPNNQINLIDYIDKIGISKKEANKIINTTGIKKLAKASASQTSSDFCISSAERILKTLNKKDISSIDAIIFVSQSPDYLIPQTSNIIQNKLNLKNEILTFDLPLGCSGYVYGLLQANILINSGCNKVLLLAGDTTTKMINIKDKTVSMVFGDAGSATLIESMKSKSYYHVASDGSNYKNLIIKDGGFRNQFSKNSLINKEYNDGVYRSDLDINMDGLSIMNFAIKRVPDSISKVLINSKLTFDQINLFALHQANKFMIDYLSKKMKLDKNKVPFNATNYGNTGPCSIPLLLSELFSSEKKINLKNTILSGFGVGLSWASCLLNLNQTKFYRINKLD